MTIVFNVFVIYTLFNQLKKLNEKKKLVSEIGKIFLFGIRTEQNIKEAFHNLYEAS